FHVYSDPRARFADSTNPDRPPMPPDDPAAWELSPHPQKPGKAGIAAVQGTGYLELLAAWDTQNRAEVATTGQKNATAKPGSEPAEKIGVLPKEAPNGAAKAKAPGDSKQKSEGEPKRKPEDQK